MKNHVRNIACVASLVFLGAQQAKAISSNTITFQGEVTTETCSVAINGNAASPVILMPTVSTRDLNAAGQTNGQTSFTVGVTGCTGDPTMDTKISTVFVGNSVSSNGNLTNTGTAKNVEVQIVSPDKNVVDLTRGYTGSGDLTLKPGETSASVDYTAQYYATGAPTAGTVKAALQYAVTYQ